MYPLSWHINRHQLPHLLLMYGCAILNHYSSCHEVNGAIKQGASGSKDNVGWWWSTINCSSSLLTSDKTFHSRTSGMSFFKKDGFFSTIVDRAPSHISHMSYMFSIHQRQNIDSLPRSSPFTQLASRSNMSTTSPSTNVIPPTAASPSLPPLLQRPLSVTPWSTYTFPLSILWHLSLQP